MTPHHLNQMLLSFRQKTLTYAALGCSLVLIVLQSCELERPPDYGRVGNVVRFSGKVWDVKTSLGSVGPGPNYFSGRAEDLFLDGKGYLHLRIAEHDGRWYSTELVGRDTCGYGTYRWVIEGDLQNIANNTVVGLFTWNDSSFRSQANSEVDIEFAKWGENNAPTLNYAVQPVNFGPYYPERVRGVATYPGDLIGVTTHEFVWRDTLIEWTSWAGEGTGGRVIGKWKFNSNNPARIKNEGGQQSVPIVIPAPENNTRTRMNYWLLGGAAPSDGKEHEVVIRSFNYIPIEP